MQNKNITLELSIDQFLISHIICIEEHLHVTFNERFVKFQAHVLGTYLPVTG